MNENVLQTIRSGMDGFSKGQKRIAAFILDNYDRAAFMTAARLGETASVSESTVVRFAAQLGYDGYPEMQKALQELIRGKLTSIQRIQVSRDQMSGADILGSVMQRDMNSIHDIIEELDRDEFERVVDKLLHAKHIYILGVRSSSFLAGYLNFYMHFIFENVTLVQSAAAGEIYEQLVHIGPGDVLLSICFPRYSKMAIHAVQFACSRKADVIAITDSPMSPMYQMATLSLLAPSDMISFVDSMTAPLSLLNALILAVGKQRKEELSAALADAAGAQRTAGQETEYYGKGPLQCDQRLRSGDADGQYSRQWPVPVQRPDPLHAPGRHGVFRGAGRTAEGGAGEPCVPCVRQVLRHLRRSGAGAAAPARPLGAGQGAGDHGTGRPCHRRTGREAALSGIRRGAGHRRRVLSRHRLYRRRLRHGGGAGAHHRAAKGFAGAAGEQRSRLRRHAGPEPAECGGYGAQRQE